MIGSRSVVRIPLRVRVRVRVRVNRRSVLEYKAVGMFAVVNVLL